MKQSVARFMAANCQLPTDKGHRNPSPFQVRIFHCKKQAGMWVPCSVFRVLGFKVKWMRKKSTSRIKRKKIQIQNQKQKAMVFKFKYKRKFKFMIFAVGRHINK